MTDVVDCAACGRSIDPNARTCPYCGSDPQTGDRFDPMPIVRAHFPPRGDLPWRERVLDYLRTRQSLVVTVVIVTIFVLVGVLHQLVTASNQTVESAVPAVPLTEITDLSGRGSASEELPLPELDFFYEGDARRIRTLLVEPGAIAPPEPPAEADQTIEQPLRTPQRPAPGQPAAAQPRR
jgi:hypothetical protein